MPGSKSSKSSVSPGPKPTDVPAPTSYSQTTVSDSTRIDILTRDHSVFKDRLDGLETSMKDLTTLSETILASIKGSPPPDTAPPKQDWKTVTFGPTEDVSNPEDDKETFDKSSKHLSQSVADGISSDLSTGIMTNVHNSKRLSHASTFRSKRRSKSIISCAMDKKPYLVKSPDNGYQPFGYQNKFKVERLDFSNCTLKKDCPINLKSLWTGLSTAALVASGNAHNKRSRPLIKTLTSILRL